MESQSRSGNFLAWLAVSPGQRWTIGSGTGHFFGALDIDGFMDKDEFKKQIDEWIKVLRNTKPAPGTHGPLIPGDPERKTEAIRSREGIPLIKPVVDDLLDISRKTGIPFHAIDDQVAARRYQSTL
jgi:LDH2 family malate/lactate/ureidoglycolate dehydrogenase